MAEEAHTPRRIAFFGGSFDPPHLGHLAIARAARDALALDRVLFAPVGSQPLKPQGAAAPFSDRLRMTELAIAGEAGFELSGLDAPDPAGRPNYTLATLESLQKEEPQAQLFCLMGADSFLSLHHWRRAAEIPFAAALIVASRPGQSLEDLAAALPEGLRLGAAIAPPRSAARPPDVGAHEILDAVGRMAVLYVLPHLEVSISASEIRSRLRSGRSLAAEPALVPSSVARYIGERHLYEQEARLARGSAERLG